MLNFLPGKIDAAARQKVALTRFGKSPMKIFTKIFSIIFLFALCSLPVFAAEIMTFTLFDGEKVDGKLSLPADASKIKELVIFVHGTGPATYDNRRKIGGAELNYFDNFAEEFNQRGIAFFTYNKRGITIGDTPPMYEKIDREKYKKVLPSIEVKDIATFIGTLRKDKRLSKAKVVLLGWSEGWKLVLEREEELQLPN